MACPEAETLALLASSGGDPEARAAIADHAASCQDCHAALVALAETGGIGGDTEPPREPARVGRYVLGRRLGAGGMGVVYEASDPELDRKIAIKMLRRGASAERLRREAQALARLAHPNVVAVHDVGEHDGQVFIAMALVDGENLRGWAAGGQHSTREILRVLASAGRGIAAAHQAGLVHRDLKPDNIFVARTGEVLVGDFGLARDADDEGAEHDEAATAATNLTMTGMVLGTPAYMPPEQAEGAATEASDQFSFCITAFEALHGTRPFAGDTFETLQENIRAARFVEPERPRPLPSRVSRALRRGLAPDPADRFPTMNALLAALEPRPSWLRRALPLAAVAAIAAALAVTVLVTRRHGPSCTAVRQELAGTWNPARRGTVLRALHDRQLLPQAALELTGELDRYAARWVAVREEACAAEAERQLSADQLAARRACLDARAADLGGVIHDLETAHDPDALLLWQRIDALWPPEGCRDEATAKLAVGPSGHAELMRAIAGLDLHASDLHELTALRDRADAARDQPAQLALDLVYGRFLIDDGSAAQADAPLQQALALAEHLGVVPARIQALALLARSACKQGRFDASSPLLVMADADAAHDAASTIDADLVMRARAECLYQRRDPGAIPLLRELIAHSVVRYGADSPRALDLHLQLGESEYALGQFDDGARELAAFDRIAARLVPAGVQAARHEEEAASAAFRGGDLALATEHQRRAVELWGGDHAQERAAALASLALMYEVGAEWQVAAATHQQVVALVPRGGASAGLRVESLVQIGVLKLQVGDVAAAAAAFEQAAGEASEVGRADLANDAEIGRGRVAVERGDFARAARILREALPAYLARPDAAAYRSGVAQFALARALSETGDPAGAAALASQAEANVAHGVDEAKTNPLGAKLVAPRTVQLDQITRWRDQHPSRARDR